MTMFPRCQKCGSIGRCNCNNNFKTIHENRVNTTAQQNRIIETLNNLENCILTLPKYQPVFEGLMSESDEYGEYVKIEDVLNCLVNTMWNY